MAFFLPIRQFQGQIRPERPGIDHGAHAVHHGLHPKEHAPNIIDHLCEACKNHFKSVLEFLDESRIPYILNPYLVKGVDYYTRTIFEIFVAEDPNAPEPRKD